MSGVYAKEPETHGRVIFDTSHGPLEVYLWSKECPRTTRFFLQLCLDGFYNNMVFHRIVPDFLIQTGAVRRSKSGQMDQERYRTYLQVVKADEAVERRRFELHSRIRFGHRGQIAMAMDLEQDDPNGKIQPQFFVTLDEAPYLDGKHVIFGTITGPTVFNAIRIGKAEVDEATSQPMDMNDAPYIKSVKIVENPVHVDLTAQNDVPWKVSDMSGTTEKKKKKNRKGKFDMNVLSFGDEVDESLAIAAAKPSQPKRPSPDADNGSHELENPENVVSTKATKQDPKELPSSRADRPVNATISRPPPPLLSSQPVKPINNKSNMSLVQKRRAKYAKGRKGKREREDETLDKLLAFQSKLKAEIGDKKRDNDKEAPQDSSLAARMARRAAATETVDGYANDEPVGYHGQVLESDDDEKDKNSSWLSTKFKCRRHTDLMVQNEDTGEGRNIDDYEVVDGKKRARHNDGDRHHNGRRKKNRYDKKHSRR